MAKRFLLSVVLISLFFAASAHADILDTLFGKKVDLGPVQVGVTITNSPPTIAKFFPLPGVFPPNFQQPFTPIAGSPNLFYIGFVGEDVNGASDLHQNTGLTSAQGFVGEIIAPANSVNPTLTRAVLDCTSLACNDPLIPGICTNPPNQVAYICQGVFLYSDPPSTYSGATPNANDLWRIQMRIQDLSNNTSPIATSGNTGFANLPNDYVQINALSAYNATAAINWPSLSITAPNQPSASPVVIYNQGNLPLSTVEFTGADLTGTNPNNPSAILRTSAFSVSGSTGGVPDASCNVPLTATQLQNGAIVSVPQVSVPYTSGGATIDNDNLYVCAYQQLNSGPFLVGPASVSYSGVWQLTAA